MVRSIHHINFIVRDLDEAIVRYEQILGQSLARRDELPERGVRAARFRIGETWLVLVQPTRPDGVPGRFLAEHGEGFFLLSFGVDSLDAEFERLGSQWDSGPTRTGADGWQVRDLDAARTLGAQLQYCEYSRR